MFLSNDNINVEINILGPETYAENIFEDVEEVNNSETDWFMGIVKASYFGNYFKECDVSLEAMDIRFLFLTFLSALEFKNQKIAWVPLEPDFGIRVENFYIPDDCHYFIIEVKIDEKFLTASNLYGDGYISFEYQVDIYTIYQFISSLEYRIKQLDKDEILEYYKEDLENILENNWVKSMGVFDGFDETSF